MTTKMRVNQKSQGTTNLKRILITSQIMEMKYLPPKNQYRLSRDQNIGYEECHKEEARTTPVHEK
jgi:hypothetical protein